MSPGSIESWSREVLTTHLPRSKQLSSRFFLVALASFASAYLLKRSSTKLPHNVVYPAIGISSSLTAGSLLLKMRLDHFSRHLEVREAQLLIIEERERQAQKKLRQGLQKSQEKQVEEAALRELLQLLREPSADMNRISGLLTKFKKTVCGTMVSLGSLTSGLSWQEAVDLLVSANQKSVLLTSFEWKPLDDTYTDAKAHPLLLDYLSQALLKSTSHVVVNQQIALLHGSDAAIWPGSIYNSSKLKLKLSYYPFEQLIAACKVMACANIKITLFQDRSLSSAEEKTLASLPQTYQEITVATS